MNISGSGLDQLIEAFDRIEKDTDTIARRGLYKAAGAIADEVKKGLLSLPVDDGYTAEGKKKHGVTAAQKADLINGFGIAHFKEADGYIETSVGFRGTGSTKTKRHPGGLPNRMLMRAVESGTSFRQKTPVVRPALNRAKSRATEEAKKEITEQIKKEF